LTPFETPASRVLSDPNSGVFVVGVFEDDVAEVAGAGAGLELVDDDLEGVEAGAEQDELVLGDRGEGGEVGADELDVVGVDGEAGLGVALGAGEAEGGRDQGVGGELEVDRAKAQLPEGEVVALGVPPALEAPAEDLAEVGGGDLGDQLEGLGPLLRVGGGAGQVVVEEGAMGRQNLEHGGEMFKRARGRGGPGGPRGGLNWRQTRGHVNLSQG